MKLRRLIQIGALAAASLSGALAGAQAVNEAPAEAPPKAALCMACHGPSGNPAMAEVPALAGQSARYLYLQLRDFQEGRRSNALMSPMAQGLSRDEMRALGNYFAAQKVAPQKFTPDAEKVRLGKVKSDETLCTMCHLGGFSGQNEIPKVAGQPYDYVLKQLRAFKARERTNDAGNMTAVASTLSDADIENLAHYIASL
ncbi:MAG: cytochrome c [Leptothrix sp. (in: b-proteobacteria)]